MKVKFITVLMLILSLIGLSTLAYSETLNRGNGGEPDSLNPHKAQGLNSHHILYDLYEGLFRYSIDGEPELAAAESYQVSEDGLTWVFQIHPEARWSNGESVTADHFLKSWQKAAKDETAAPYGYLFNNLKSSDGQLQVETLSAVTLKIKLNKANPMFAAQLVLPVFMPLFEPDGLSPPSVFNGAYHLSRRDLQEKITLNKNEHYYEKEAVFFQRINYWVTENQSSELNRFRAGELDITETIPDAKINWLRENMPNELRVAPYYGTFFLGLDVRDEWLQNASLRQALYWSIDRKILVNKVLKSGQKPALSLIPRNYNTNGLDLMKARQALLQSGFDVTADRLTLLYNNSQNQKKVALAVAAMWRQNLGVKTKLQNQEWKVFVSSRKKPGKQVFRGGWIADYLDPMNFLQLFHSESEFNYYGFNNKSYDKLLLDWQDASQEKRESIVIQAERLLLTEVPMIPLYHYVSRHLVGEKLVGFESNVLDQHLSRYISLKE